MFGFCTASYFSKLENVLRMPRLKPVSLRVSFRECHNSWIELVFKVF